MKTAVYAFLVVLGVAVVTFAQPSSKVLLVLCKMPASTDLEDGCKPNCNYYTSDTSGCVFVPELGASLKMECSNQPKCGVGSYFYGHDCSAERIHGFFKVACSCMNNRSVDCLPTQSVVKDCADATCRSCTPLVTAPINQCANYEINGNSMSLKLGGYSACTTVLFRRYADTQCKDKHPSPATVMSAGTCELFSYNSTQRYTGRFHCYVSH